MSALNRLRWKCRRGTLELDLLLQRFLAEDYLALPLAAQREFEQLLEAGDEELWALIDGRISASSVHTQAVVERLRAC